MNAHTHANDHGLVGAAAWLEVVIAAIATSAWTMTSAISAARSTAASSLSLNPSPIANSGPSGSPAASPS
ncbi:MAG: hypothetical protein ACOC0P_00260 [Planctomycetota bacterium]